MVSIEVPFLIVYYRFDAISILSIIPRISSCSGGFDEHQSSMIAARRLETWTDSFWSSSDNRFIGQ